VKQRLRESISLQAGWGENSSGAEKKKGNRRRRSQKGEKFQGVAPASTRKIGASLGKSAGGLAKVQGVGVGQLGRWAKNF